MKLGDLLRITKDRVYVYAPAYDKHGNKYKDANVFIGAYYSYNCPKVYASVEIIKPVRCEDNKFICVIDL